MKGLVILVLVAVGCESADTMIEGDATLDATLEEAVQWRCLCDPVGGELDYTPYILGCSSASSRMSTATVLPILKQVCEVEHEVSCECSVCESYPTEEDTCYGVPL